MFPNLHALRIGAHGGEADFDSDAARRARRKQRSARRGRSDAVNDNERLVEYGFSRAEAREFMWRIHRFLGKRLNAGAYEALWNYVTGVYHDTRVWNDERVEDLKDQVGTVWDRIFVDENIPGAVHEHGLFRRYSDANRESAMILFFNVNSELSRIQGSAVYDNRINSNSNSISHSRGRGSRSSSSSSSNSSRHSRHSRHARY